MFNKVFSTAALALLASSLVSAQTYTSCNPLKKTCPADSAFGSSVTCDFTQGKCSAFKEADGTTIKYDDKGAHFEILQESNAPTVSTGKYIFFGRIDVVCQAAAGQGIVTSAVLQSDDLDEIDWEWVGGDNTQVQTNYFSKGDTTTYDRGAYHPVANPLGSYHKYSVEWTSTYVNWLIDDNVVRTLKAADAKGGEAFPQTPMQIKLGTWVAGGKNSAEGTVQWAGGYTDFTKAPFNAYYKSITIVDYAGNDKAGDYSDVSEYVYGDNSGSWKSIVVKKGDSTDDKKTKTATSSAAATSSAPATSTATSAAQSKTQTQSSAATSAADSKAHESKSIETKTTLTTAAAHTPSQPKVTSVTGGYNATSAGVPAVVTGGQTTARPSTVPTAGASRLSSGMFVAAAGLFLAQLL